MSKIIIVPKDNTNTKRYYGVYEQLKDTLEINKICHLSPSYRQKMLTLRYDVIGREIVIA